MPSVAEVQFKATGQQQVVTAFKSVGDAAATGTTKIEQNSSAMKSVGQGMKSSVSSIGAVATSFATLSLAVVGTWRAYRDLGDAQIAVDAANLKVQKSTEAVRKAQVEVNKIKKEGSKGSLDTIVATNKIRLAEEKLAKDRKSGKKTALELKAAQDEINLARHTLGTGATAKLQTAEEKLRLAQETLTLNTTRAGEAQERFNDTQQDFYLSILPTGIGVIGSLATVVGTLKATIGTGKLGLVGAFGGLGLVLGAASAALLAYQNNWLGFKDIMSGVVKWFQDRFGAWKDTLEEVFGFIQKQDWGGAFNRIKEAAAAFWEDLKKSVPFFGEVESLVEKIRKGNWKGAFLQIWKAASDAWATVKKNVPILGKVEDVIKAISEGKWGEAFQKIADTAKEIFNNTLGKGIAFLFGDNWKLGLDAWLVLQEAEAKAKNRSLILQYAITINASITAITGIDVMKWFKDHPLTAATINLPLSGITLAVEDPTFQAALKKGAEIILGALGTALTAAAKTLDPFLADAIKALNFNTAVIAAGNAIKTAGEGIWNALFNGIKAGFQGQDWGKIFGDLPKAVNDWWAKNFPGAQKALIANFQSSPMAKGLGAVGIKFEAHGEMSKDTPTKIQSGITNGVRGGYKVPLATDTRTFDQQLSKVKTDVGKKPATMKIDASLTAANAKWQQFMHKVATTKVNVPVGVAGGSTNIRIGSQKGAYGPSHQHGYQGTVKRPTLFIAGEGGRPEDVTVRPRGSVQRGGSGGGAGFSGTINVYVDGVLRPARYDMGARK